MQRFDHPAGKYYISTFTADPRSCFRDHCHKSPHLFFLTSGMMTEEDGRNEVTVEPGLSRASRAGVSHHVAFGETPANCIAIHFLDAELAGYIAGLAGSGNGFRSIGRMGQFGCDLIAKASRLETFLYADLHLRELISVLRSDDIGDPPAWLEQAKFYLLNSTEVSPEIESVAEEVGVSREHLTRSYNKFFGVSPIRVRKICALSRALEALGSDGVDAADAAVIGGFYDQAHFTNALRNELGYTPSKMKGLLTRSSC